MSSVVTAIQPFAEMSGELASATSKSGRPLCQPLSPGATQGMTGAPAGAACVSGATSTRGPAASACPAASQPAAQTSTPNATSPARTALRFPYTLPTSRVGSQSLEHPPGLVSGE